MQKNKSIFFFIFISAVALISCGGSEFSTSGKDGKTGLPSLKFKPKAYISKVHFLVPPYLQPGSASKLEQDTQVITWQTEYDKSDFSVEYGIVGETRKTEQVKNYLLPSKDKKHFLYKAFLNKLSLNKTYNFTILKDNQACYSGEFKTRKTDSSLKFMVFGDTGGGSERQIKLAKVMNKTEADFALHVGDISYPRGLSSEYLKEFFPIYNAHKSLYLKEKPQIQGANFMQRIPIYFTIGNHDVYFSKNLDEHPDALAAFYYSDSPRNGPVPAKTMSLQCSEERLEQITKLTSDNPAQKANFSYDYGNAHFIVLDGSLHIHPLDKKRLEWIEKDLRKSKAKWKFVSIHQAPFCTNLRHIQLGGRLLAPTFEKYGVDMIFSGHLHCYERTKPLKFTPKSTIYPQLTGNLEGKFTIDKKFDGIKNLKPEGPIYIISGAGGSFQYGREFTFTPEKWEPFTAKYIADRSSFTYLDIKDNKLVLKQIDQDGAIIDAITIQK